MNNQTAELISFCQIMTTALKSGRPLPHSLLNLKADKVENSQAVIWCRDLGKSLSDGYPLEEAVKQLKNFDPVLARLLKLLGQNRLIKMLEAYTRYLVIIETLNQKVFAAIIYPFFIILFIGAILINFNFFLFPRAMSDMVAADMAPSLMMRLLYFADISFWPLALILPLIILLTFIMLLHFMIRGIYSHNSILGGLFLLNRVVLAQNAARAQAVTSLYLEAGLSLEESLSNAAQLFNDQENYNLKNVVEALKSGRSPKEAFEVSPLLNSVSMAAESKENLTEIFKRFSRANFRISVSFLRAFTDVSAVLALLMAGFFVLCITSSLFDTYYWLIWSY